MTPPTRVALCYRCEDRDADDVYHRIAPSGLLSIHGVLRANGVDSRLFNFSGWTLSAAKRALTRFRPQAAGVSHFTFNHAASVALYRILREAAPGALLVGGGAQATFLDQQILTGRWAPDLIVRGEGELTLLRVVRDGGRDPAQWRRIRGLSWRGPRGVERTNPAPLASRLDPLYPRQRFEALEGVTGSEQFGFVVTSRGCPASCAFCSAPKFWGRRLRFRSAAGVLDEIAWLVEQQGLRRFSIRDDTFTADQARVREFCRGLKRRGLGASWNCQSRVTFIDDESLAAMKRAGCEHIQFGVESASPSVLQTLGKSIRLDDIERALAACRRVGIAASAYFITGAPGQRMADIWANRRLFEDFDLADGIVAPLVYHPGTALFEAARRRGVVGPEIFLSGRPERLLVRRDAAARRQFEALTALIGERRREIE